MQGAVLEKITWLWKDAATNVLVPRSAILGLAGAGWRVLEPKGGKKRSDSLWGASEVRAAEGRLCSTRQFSGPLLCWVMEFSACNYFRSISCSLDSKKMPPWSSPNCGSQLQAIALLSVTVCGSLSLPRD